MKRKLGLAAVGLASVFAAVILLAEAKHPGISLHHLKRSPLKNGGELITGTVQRGADRGEVLAVYVDPKAVEFDVAFNPKKNALRTLAPKAWFVANAGYFTKSWKPTGLLATRGRILRKLEEQGGGAGSGVIRIDNGKVSLMTRSEAKQVDFRKVDLGLQAGPRIIEAGGVPGIRSDDGARANRTVIGVDGRGHLVVAIFYFGDGGFASGPTLFELMHLLGPTGLGKAHPKAALTAALNLDGGPSTGAVLRGTAEQRDLPTLGSVQHGLALYDPGVVP